MKKRKTAREKRQEYRAMVEKRDFDFWLEFYRDGKFIEKYSLPGRGQRTEAIIQFEEKHGKAPYTMEETEFDAG